MAALLRSAVPWDNSFRVHDTYFSSPCSPKRKGTGSVNSLCSWPGAAILLYGSWSHRTDLSTARGNHSLPLCSYKVLHVQQKSYLSMYSRYNRVAGVCSVGSKRCSLHLISPEHPYVDDRTGVLSSTADDIHQLEHHNGFLLQCMWVCYHQPFVSSWAKLHLSSYASIRLQLMHKPLSCSSPTDRVE